MSRVFQLVCFIALGSFGTSLVADEPRPREQSPGELIKQLRDSDPDKVCAAAKALGKLGSASEAAPALKELLKSRNGRIKWTAAEALWLLEHRAADLVPIYAELLTTKDANVRAASAWRLGRFGSDARPAVPVLAAALRDESLEVRVQVGQALANLGPFAEPALPALVRALGDKQLDESNHGDREEKSVQHSPALPALLELADDAIPLLIEVFREHADPRLRNMPTGEPESDVPHRIASAFPAFGARAVAPLLKALDSKDVAVRRYAASALDEMAQFNGLPTNAIDRLEKCMDDPDRDVCQLAAEIMSRVRPTNTKAVAIFARMIEENHSVHMLADLERMIPHNEAALKLLFRVVESKDAKTAQEAHHVLARLKLPADQELAVWTRALSHADSKRRSEAIYALRGCGPAAKPAKSALHERFNKEDDRDCKSAILDALFAIDPDDPVLVPILIKALDDPESWARWSALGHLEALGPRAKAALPRIEARLLNPEKKGKKERLDDSEMRHLVGAMVRIAPGSARTASTLLKA